MTREELYECVYLLQNTKTSVSLFKNHLTKTDDSFYAVLDILLTVLHTFLIKTVYFISCSSMFWPLGHSSLAHNPLKNLHMSDVTPPDLYRLNQKHKTLVIAGWFCPQRCDSWKGDYYIDSLGQRYDVRACDQYKTIQYVTFISTLIYPKSKIFPHCWLIPLFLFLFLGCLWFPAWRLLALFRKGAAHEWKHWHRRIWMMAAI